MIVLQTTLFLFESFFCSCFGFSCTDDVDVFWAFHRIYHDDYEISGDIRESFTNNTNFPFPINFKTKLSCNNGCYCIFMIC